MKNMCNITGIKTSNFHNQTAYQPKKNTAMKTVKLIRAFFLFLMLICISGISSFAKEPATPPVPAPAEHLQKIIKEGVKYPEKAVRQCCTGSVDVIFTVNEEGKIIIEKTISDNADIEHAVKEQLSAICCKGVKTPFNEHYKIKITFTLVG